MYKALTSPVDFLLLCCRRTHQVICTLPSQPDPVKITIIHILHKIANKEKYYAKTKQCTHLP